MMEKYQDRLAEIVKDNDAIAESLDQLDKGRSNYMTREDNGFVKEKKRKEAFLRPHNLAGGS